MVRSERYVYRFGNGVADADDSMRALLGNKGAGLVQMSRLSIPVPPGFIIGTNACHHYFKHGTLPPSLTKEIKAAMQWLGETMGREFNNAQNPLLVSVRSGSVVSMPGMMDTILNVGLSQSSIDGLVSQSGSTQLALDSYRRLIQMFSAVVLDVPKGDLDQVMTAIYANHSSGGLLSDDALREAIHQLRAVVLRSTGEEFPDNGDQQLQLAIQAVIESWSNERARFYRRLNGISDDLGTAVTVQAMVMGNAGAESGTGVGFTRNPSTGEKEIFGEFLANAQGEDIVSGARTPVSIASLKRSMPDVYEELSAIVMQLEQHYRDVQDFEFTVENRKLFLLQTRSAKRSAIAAVRTAVDMVAENLITKDEAISRVNPASISEILAPQLDFTTSYPTLLTTGIAASPGAAVGRIAFSSAEVVRMAKQPDHDPLILISHETTAEDIHGMALAAGFLTAHGGATSHAAVVARGMGKCCITGAKEIVIDKAASVLRIGDQTLHKGDWISLDGSTGRIFSGQLLLRAPDEKNEALQTLLDWTKDIATLDVRANADTPLDAVQARIAGARGIGLCRTEHMFFAPERLPHVRAMILASSTEDRQAPLEQLLPMQQHDFEALFREMSPLPVTIRLLDPPLHEFLPSLDEARADLENAAITNREVRKFKQLTERIQALTEINPMMGHRGCRLSITYPEILEMQVKAILQAAINVIREGYKTVPEIMVPLIASAEEMSWLRKRIDHVASEVFAHAGMSIPYLVGTMIELPRAAICAHTIAQYVDFASFGTNDLTQMTFGLSRDDSSVFLNHYLEHGILPSDPFVTLDREGVGNLIRIAINGLRETNPEIKIGICGEHGGDPASIHFFSTLGIDYVSCSPARIRTARLAAAQISRNDSHISEMPSLMAT
ncbi:pyruvate, phosphate dikinase [Edaphobacter flagellatus]|uniref:pyruvate, phosphate dikinase n=1 Tax=Edaphobacter flagellatus TaxID=1933044 RepID=UPI0021B21A26|nr:pyruvate, phosphate dikinase [Edaphobacter flagellatus]